jgi:hypothetical protein
MFDDEKNIHFQTVSEYCEKCMYISLINGRLFLQVEHCQTIRKYLIVVC